MAEFKEKFVGYLDILGFKDMVKKAENGTGRPLPEILGILKTLGSFDRIKDFNEIGPTVCPGSPHLQRDLDFKITQLSDCAIVSSEVSPAGLINLVDHFSGVVLGLLTRHGVLCRGYITLGNVYHSENQIIGSAYQEAYSKEVEVTAFKRGADERGTPFVEIDSKICDYVKKCDDEHVKKMFSNMVKNDGEIVALFPFNRLSTPISIGGGSFGGKLDPEKGKESNRNLRKGIGIFKERVMAHVDQSNPKVVRKVEYYIQILNEILEMSYKADEMIDRLQDPFPAHRLPFY